MYKKLFLMFCMVAINYMANAQTTIRGTVKNHNGEPISYCSIGIRNSDTGAVSDENGNYTLTISDDLKEDIIFSAFGYQDEKKHKNELLKNSHLILEPESTVMETMVINLQKMKEKTIGQKKRPMLTFSKMFDKNVPTIEQGTIFKLYEKTKLKSYQFHIIPSSRYAQITLKLNIYEVKNNIPGKVLLDENIIFKTSATGWQKIDLSSYGLVFNNKNEIAVTMQLVDYKPLENEAFSFGISAKKSLAKNLLFRYQSQGNWERSEGIFISSLEIAYLKKNNDKEVLKDIEDEIVSAEDAQIKMLATYYQSKEQAAKTIYGKSKKGKYVDTGDATIYYESYGKGTPLLLLHGNNGNISDFYNQIPLLSKYFEVIAIDTRGQGRSTDMSTADYSYELFAADLLKVIESNGWKKVSIIGWSDGGNTGLIFNSQHPDRVNKLVTIGSNLEPSGVSEDLLAEFEKQLAEKKGNLRLVRLMLNHPHINSAQLASIQNEVLVIAGSEDVIKKEHTQLIHESIKDSDIEIIPDATHYIPFEQPEKLNNILLTFLLK